MARFLRYPITEKVMRPFPAICGNSKQVRALTDLPLTFKHNFKSLEIVLYYSIRHSCCAFISLL